MNFTNHPFRSNIGAALVVALAFLVLITVSVLVFFASAQLRRQIAFSGVSQVTAETLAHNAVNILTSELISEIASTNNSRISGANGTNLPVTVPWVFQPLARSNAVPERRGTLNSTWTNVVKRSSPSSAGSSPLAFFSGGRNLIAADPSADTTNRSLNGRFLDDVIWAAPQLLSTNASQGLSPRWCYITRSGAQSVGDADLAALSNPAGTNYGIGRFACVVYDVGGLLDINAAGNALPGSDNASRGFLNQASLAQVPGVDAGRFVNWRSAATQSDVTWLLAGGGEDYRRIRSGDQTFTSRQDLLRYATKDPSIISPTALPFLTVFSREVNAPSWGPDQNAEDFGGSATFSYRDNANLASATNRFIPNVRMPVTATLTNYPANGGSAATYTVKAGEGAIPRRFPLRRLDWIGRNGPQNGGTPQNIQSCFGLVWDSGNKRWNYTGATGNTPLTSIATLASVAAESREPNFFELFQAGILSGSLGLSSSNTMMLAEASFASAVNQVMQIGANVIDQWDADSYPTRIHFNGNELCGSESLPYLNKIVYSLYRPMSGPTLTGSLGTIPRASVHTWVEFEVWNPYEGAGSPQPEHFRIRQVSGSFRQSVDRERPDLPLGPGGSKAVTLEFSAPAATSGWLTLDLSGGLTAQDPALLDTLRRQGATVQSGDPKDILQEINSNGIPVSYTGIWSGEILMNPNWPSANLLRSRLYCDVDTTYEWQVNYGSPSTPDWRTVQKLTIGRNPSLLQGFATAARSGQDENPDLIYQYLDGDPNRRRSSCAAVDPRVLRLGLTFVSGSSFAGYPRNAHFWDRSLARSTNPAEMMEDLSGANGPAFSPNFPNGPGSLRKASFRLGDNRGTGSTNAPTYQDPDGVQRFGDAIWGTVFPSFPIATHSADRPVILNRPFRSVGDMGYAFRDLPFKSLDFWTDRSADAGLLDLFCIEDPTADGGLVAGKVNLNTPHPQVLQALLAGVTRADLQPSSEQISGPEAQAVANALVAMTHSINGPLLNPAELATRFASGSGLTNLQKTRREAVVRALAGMGQTRTWNFLIDVVAQVGRFPLIASNLGQFQVEGEFRCWAHVAIDRYTGKIVDMRIEPVTGL